MRVYWMYYTMSMANKGGEWREAFQADFDRSHASVDEAQATWENEKARLGELLTRVREAFDLTPAERGLVEALLAYDVTELEPGDWSPDRSEVQLGSELRRTYAVAADHVKRGLHDPLVQLLNQVETRFFA